ncbi:MAG TPA: biotin--[acetyl-CoA-carboxylase] ligase [Burkholderiales bacterium]|nr:biotin--[acetyl-CoA-carboxylase] ligase [Burkholderiales bacterium]
MSGFSIRLLGMLADGNFHSGQELADEFKVSRTTIWEGVRRLEALGVPIFSVRGHGYALVESIELLDLNKVRIALPDNYSYDLRIVDCLESTNITLASMAGDLEKGTAIAAEIQTAGRGRLGRVWLAAPGLSLTFSMLWRFESGIAALGGLSLAVGLACATALRELGCMNINLKWPNDLVCGNEKLGGILIETHGDLQGPIDAIIGIGININVPEAWSKALGRKIANIYTSGTRPDRNRILATLLAKLTSTLEEFEKNGFIGMKEAWRKMHIHENCLVSLSRDGKALIAGRARGVSDEGALLVETNAGVVEVVSGDISLVGEEV